MNIEGTIWTWAVALALAPALARPAHAQLQEHAKLVAGDAEPLDWLGYVSSISEDTAVVGAFRDDDAGSNSGAAYVFVCSGGGWSEQAKLTASDASGGDWFGYFVAISGDTVVVGAPEDDPDLDINAGSAYVFVRDGTSWTQQAKLTASIGQSGDEFGASVAIAGDTILVNALRDDLPGAVNAGSAYVFVRNGTSWTQQAKLTANDAAAEDLLFAAALSEDGNTAVLGAFRDDHAGGTDAGSAYVFVRSGTSWSQQAKLVASDAAADDQFGVGLAISGDTVVIGAYKDDHAAGVDAGSAYVFVRSGTSWSEQQKLVASDAAAGDELGIGVGLAGDRAVVGAWLADLVAGANAGAAYLFERSGTSWSEQEKLVASDAAMGDKFGSWCAISRNRAVIGAYLDDHAGGTNAGSAYLYRLPATAFPYNGDGINVDVLSASPMVLGGMWTASVALGHAHGSGGALVVQVRASTVNGPNGVLTAARLGGPGCVLLGTVPCHPTKFGFGEVLIAGPLFASIVGTHDGVTGSIPPQAIPSSLCLTSWAAQALVTGGGFVDLSTAVFGETGQ